MPYEYYVVDPDGKDWDNKWNGFESKAQAKKEWEYTNSYSVEYEDEADGVWKVHSENPKWNTHAVPEGWTIRREEVPQQWNTCMTCGTSIRAPQMWCRVCGVSKEPVGLRE